jgi:hypothetical protein
MIINLLLQPRSPSNAIRLAIGAITRRAGVALLPAVALPSMPDLPVD